MAKVENDYRLVLFEAPADPRGVRDLMAGVTGIHPTDAMQWVARAPGVWPRPLAEGEVRELLDGLYELGVPAEAHRLDLLPALSPARTIHDAAVLPQGLRIKGLRGEPTHWVPWEKVELVAAGRVAAEDEYRDVSPPPIVQAVVTGLNALLRRPMAHRRRQRAMRIVKEPAFEAIVVRKDPRISFRVVAHKMNYSALGERLLPSAAANFPILLADLCAHAQWAFLADSTLDVLGGRPAEFSSSQALLDYAQHRLLWSWYRRDRDAAAAEGP